MKYDNIIGIKHDWKEYDKAIKGRWEQISPRLMKCKLHDTIFTHAVLNAPIMEGDEPCWQCWEEFEIVIE